MKRTWKQLCIALAVVLAAAFFGSVAAPTVVEAKTYSVSANTNYKKAPALKLKRVYLVKAKKNYGITKFTAPSNGKYAVKISNIHTIGVQKNTINDSHLGNFRIKKLRNNYLWPQDVKTKGGKTSCVNMATSYFYKNYTTKGKVTTYTDLPSREAVISLKKGETIYCDLFYTGKKCTYNLQIKKK
ncbi:MAG: hypothetical protein ACI4HI_12415 [Lachnospiraceae bacterium]